MEIDLPVKLIWQNITVVFQMFFVQTDIKQHFCVCVCVSAYLCVMWGCALDKERYIDAEGEGERVSVQKMEVF